MADFTCSSELENLINDFNLFIQTLEGDTATLSDGFVIDSYQTVAVEELKRGGAIWDSTYSYFKDDVITKNDKLFICLVNNKNKDPEANTVEWKELQTVQTSYGDGISAYVYFNLDDLSIISQNNILSITTLNNNEIEIKTKKGVGAGNKLVFAVSYNSLYLDLSNPDFSTPSNYFVGYKVLQNEDDTIVLKFTSQVFNPQINIIFMEV